MEIIKSVEKETTVFKELEGITDLRIEKPKNPISPIRIIGERPLAGSYDGESEEVDLNPEAAIQICDRKIHRWQELKQTIEKLYLTEPKPEINLPTLLIKAWRNEDVFRLPEPPQNGDAGTDCYIHGFYTINHNTSLPELIEIKNTQVRLESLDRIGCGLGFAAAIPEGYYANLLPRSGLAFFEGIHLTLGTIDLGYRKEWIAIITNLSKSPVQLVIGEKICQYLLLRKEPHRIEIAENLPPSTRGMNGFGSTGK